MHNDSACASVAAAACDGTRLRMGGAGDCWWCVDDAHPGQHCQAASSGAGAAPQQLERCFPRFCIPTGLAISVRLFLCAATVRAQLHLHSTNTFMVRCSTLQLHILHLRL